jgi:hypothetical protein
MEILVLMTVAALGGAVTFKARSSGLGGLWTLAACGCVVIVPFFFKRPLPWFWTACAMAALLAIGAMILRQPFRVPVVGLLEDVTTVSALGLPTNRSSTSEDKFFPLICLLTPIVTFASKAVPPSRTEPSRVALISSLTIWSMMAFAGALGTSILGDQNGLVRDWGRQLTGLTALSLFWSTAARRLLALSRMGLARPYFSVASRAGIPRRALLGVILVFAAAVGVVVGLGYVIRAQGQPDEDLLLQSTLAMTFLVPALHAVAYLVLRVKNAGQPRTYRAPLGMATATLTVLLAAALIVYVYEDGSSGKGRGPWFYVAAVETYVPLAAIVLASFIRRVRPGDSPEAQFALELRRRRARQEQPLALPLP